MAGAGRMQTALASEAMRQKSRQQEYEAEQGKLFTSLVFPEKLRALAEKPSTSPKSPLAFVNRAFNFFPTSSRRATVDAAAPINPVSQLAAHRRNISLDALDKVELLPPEPEEQCSDLEVCEQQQQQQQREQREPAAKQEVKRIYVSRPLVRRRFSVDDRPCVTIFSSEAPAKPTHVSPPPRLTAPLAPRLLPGNLKLREQRARDVVDAAPQRVFSFPNLDYGVEEDLRYWRDVLHNSPQLKALEK